MAKKTQKSGVLDSWAERRFQAQRDHADRYVGTTTRPRGTRQQKPTTCKRCNWLNPGGNCYCQNCGRWLD